MRRVKKKNNDSVRERGKEGENEPACSSHTSHISMLLLSFRSLNIVLSARLYVPCDIKMTIQIL